MPIVEIALIASLLAIVAGIILYRMVLAAPATNPRAQEIAEAIRTGAEAFLNRQYRTIGLVGVGLLGSAVAERLVGGGFAVVGFDLDEARREGLRAIGGEAVASAADVAQRCRRIVLSLPDAGVSQVVVAEMEADLHAGATVIDTTTGAPEAMVAIGTSLASRDVAYVDATIGGSSVQARAGDVIVMAGGEAEAVESCTDLPFFRYPFWASS